MASSGRILPPLCVRARERTPSSTRKKPQGHGLSRKGPARRTAAPSCDAAWPPGGASRAPPPIHRHRLHPRAGAGSPGHAADASGVRAKVRVFPAARPSLQPREGGRWGETGGGLGLTRFVSCAVGFVTCAYREEPWRWWSYPARRSHPGLARAARDQCCRPPVTHDCRAPQRRECACALRTAQGWTRAGTEAGGGSLGIAM